MRLCTRFARFREVVRGPNNARTEKNTARRTLCEKANLAKNAADRLSEVSQNLADLADIDSAAICAHCSAPILPGSAHAAISSGEYLHYACTDAWATAAL